MSDQNIKVLTLCKKCKSEITVLAPYKKRNKPFMCLDCTEQLQGEVQRLREALKEIKRTVTGSLGWSWHTVGNEIVRKVDTALSPQKGETQGETP